MSKPTAKKVVDYAKKFVRQKSYGQVNIFTKWYYGNNTAAAYCAIFVYYCLAHCGGKELMKGCSQKAYVPTVYNWAKKKGYLKPASAKAKLGDIVIYDWNDDGTADHEGFVIKDMGSRIQTVEGNTSNVNNSNGGCVQVRVRNKNDVKGFVRLPYATSKKVAKNVTKGRVTASKGLNIRNKPSLKGKVIKAVPHGTILSCYGTKKAEGYTWWAVKSDKSQWAAAKYIKKV